jgi:signal transduction histidine kinase
VRQAEQTFDSLSGGQQARFQILLLELSGATLLLLDEPTDNLVSNALKFTPRGGTVTVAVDERDAQVVVSVRDTGMGIPADEQQKLFTRFFRASTATRNAVPGVGLGLTITRAIVHAHGGELQFESEEGVGTEFRMLLPVAPRTQPLLRVVAAPSDG